MGLREQAAADLKAILEDSAAGFGWDITVTDPEDTEAELVGFSTDIAEMIDPQTGSPVSGRSAIVSIALASLADAGLGIPKAIIEKTSRPWLVSFDDISGVSHSFKVAESRPDRAIGVVVLVLEAYDG